ncbi:TPA: hypothetical protein ACX6RX_003161 [Photobacterium damselae]
MAVKARLEISGEGGDARERFCDLYTEGGKTALVHDFLAAGTILKEAGLLDIVLNLDKSVEFRNAPNTLKTRMLLRELGEIFSPAVGGQSPVVPVAGGDVKPRVTTESKPLETEVKEQSKPVVEEPVRVVRKRSAPDLGV